MFAFQPAALADTGTNLIFSDDFENYTVHEPLLTGYEVTVGEHTDDSGNTTKWVSAPSTMSSFGYDTVMADYGIAYAAWTIPKGEETADETNKTLKISSKGNAYNIVQYPAVILDSFNLDATKSYTIEVELKASRADAGSAVRFFVHNNGKNYYELYFPGQNGIDTSGTDANVVLRKVINNSPTTLTSKYVQDAFPIYTAHCKLKLSINRGHIMWTLEALDNVANYNLGIWHALMDSAIDPQPFDAEVSKLAFAAGGQNEGYVYFDNLKVYENTFSEDVIALENFDNYTADDYNFATTVGYGELDENGITTTRNNGYLGAWWTTTPRYYANSEGGFGNPLTTPSADDLGVVADENDETNKVFKMSSRAAWDAYQLFMTLFYDGAVVNSGEKIAISVDTNKDHAQVGQRILFMMHDQEKSENAPSKPESGRYLNSYYALYFPGINAIDAEGNQLSGVMLDKYVGGERIRVYESETTEKLSTNSWYNIEIKIDGKNITWTVKDKDTGFVQTDFCGKYIDPEPFTTTQSCKMALQAGGQYDKIVYWDNVSVRKISNTEVVYSDNFNSYTAAENTEDYVTTNNTVVAGNWTTNAGTWGWTVSDTDYNYPSAAVIFEPGNSNVLAVETQADYTKPNAFVSIEPADLTLDTTNVYTYKFDYYRADESGGGGIRFNKNGQTDFYELYFQAGNGYEDGTMKTSLAKKSDNVYTRLNETEVTITGESLEKNTLAQKTWYNVELTVDGGNISWTVKEKSTNTVVQTGNYTDPSPLEFSEATVSFFGAGQDAQYVYFDNFSVVRSLFTDPLYTVYNDKLTLEFTPDSIIGIEDMEKLQVVVAYYDSETNEFLSVEVKEIIDFTENVTADFALNKTAGAFAKVYIWNGSVAEAKSAYKIITIE